MNTMPLSFQTPIKQTIKGTESKTAAAATSETIEFASLLTAVSSGAAEIQTTTENQKKELLGKLEQVLASLQEIPQENLTPEQQEMIQAIMQLLTQQLQPPKEQLQETVSLPESTLNSSSLEEKLVIENLNKEQPLQKELVLATPNLEKLAGSPTDQKKLVTLLEEAVEVLQKLAVAAPTENTKTALPIDAKKLEQVFGQLASLVESLKTDQQKSETKTAAIQVQQLEQVLKQVTGLKQEPINLVQPKEIQQLTALPIAEASTQAKATPEEVAAKLQEAPAPAAQADQGQPTATAGTEAAKASTTPQRTEATVPQATVRMSNLVEELGEVLRGSFRLNGEGDSKQIKISIFPEHLGHMDIRLTSVDGKIVAQIFTSSLAAKEMLDQQASLLRSSMTQQGITVEKIEISQQSSQQSFGQQSAHPDQRFSQQQKQGPSSRNRNGYQSIEEDAAAIVRRQASDGSMMKVDYTI